MTFLRIVITLNLLFKHDLRATLRVCREGKPVPTHRVVARGHAFSGSCPRVKQAQCPRGGTAKLGPAHFQIRPLSETEFNGIGGPRTHIGIVPAPLRHIPP